MTTPSGGDARGEEILLYPGEELVWRGAPRVWRFALDAFRLREIAAYATFLIGLQVWRSVDRGDGVAGAAPFAALIAAAFAIFAVIAWRTARGVTYTATNRRLVLTYGIAMRATLSLPFSSIGRISRSAATGQGIC